MNARASDGYARARLLELLGIEPLVPIGARDRPVAGPDASTSGRAAARATPPPGAAFEGRSAATRFTLQVEPGDRGRYPVLLEHLAAALGAGGAAFEPGPGRHAICFGTTPPDAGATLAPPLSALSRSPAAKRALWTTLRALRAGRPER